MKNQNLQSTKDSLKPYSDIKKTDRFILKCGQVESELTAGEYCVVDSLLKSIKSGKVHPNSFYRCKRTGETFNLAHFSYLIRKKSSEPKIFGEDIKL
jgi:hypothetical protein